MAIRNIVKVGDETLTKKSREVSVIDARTKQLAKDMIETLRVAEGVGLAAPQVGVLRRIIVIEDVRDEENREEFASKEAFVFINPEIISSTGENIGPEGCLSVPGVQGIVNRPQKVHVRALNQDGVPFELHVEGLMARAVCHEVDHLNGVIFTEKVISYINNDEEKDV